MAEKLVDQDTSYGADNEYRIALIGRTGSGKSATGNNILGRKAFISTSSGSSVTTNCLFHTAERFGKKLVVVDTPELCNTALPADVVDKEIRKFVRILTPGPHAFILIVQIGRFTEEEQNSVHLFSHIFGEEFFRYLIVIFTRRDDLENDDRTIQEYVKDVPEALKSILQGCNNRYLAFDNTKRCQTNESDVQELIGFVKVIMTETGTSYYLNDSFKKSEFEFQQRAKKIRDLGEKSIVQIKEKKEAIEKIGYEHEAKGRENTKKIRELDEKIQQQHKEIKNMRDNDRRRDENEDEGVMRQFLRIQEKFIRGNISNVRELKEERRKLRHKEVGITVEK